MADAGSLRSCLALKVSLVTRGTSLDHSSLGFFQRVLVSLDCYNKIPQTRGLTDNRKVFLGVLEAGNPMPRLWLIRCLAGGWLSFPCSDGYALAVSSLGRERKRWSLSRSLLIRALILS